MLSKIINSKSKTFLTFCFAFLLGIIIFSLLEIKLDFIFLYVSLFVIASLLIIFWKNNKVRFIILCLLLFIFGVGRYLLAFPLQEQDISSAPQEIEGYVSAEPDVRMDGVRYIIKSNSVKGKIYLKSLLYPRYGYGDKLLMECKLVLPEASDDFRYDMYLARYGVFSVCEKAKVKKVGDSEGSKILAGIFDVKNVVASRINNLWHEPNASFMAGLLYGYRGGLGNLNELFSRTGVTHIVAISGYNITIIATILISICISLYIPRKKAFWFITIGIILFVLFAGASASVVRAGIMGIIVLLAKQMGRTSQVGNVLVLTAVVMALQNPLVLIWDAGFQLSFISTLGLVYVTPVIRNWFNKVPEIMGIRESLISTLAAITATLPLILFQFGRLSIVAPIVNILILWIIPTIMMLGFLAVLISFLLFPLGEVVAWIAWVGLQYITSVVEFFASLSWSAVDLKISWWMMVLLYVFLIYFVKRKSYSVCQK
jgi:competence protein ComEC